jgi:hypothetical protein
MKIKREPTQLEKKARRGQRGYPVATIAFYGPDASRASKVAAGIVRTEDGWPTQMKKWFSDTGDVRQDAAIGDEVIEFIEEHGGKTFVLSPESWDARRGRDRLSRWRGLSSVSVLGEPRSIERRGTSGSIDCPCG